MPSSVCSLATQSAVDHFEKSLNSTIQKAVTAAGIQKASFAGHNCRTCRHLEPSYPQLPWEHSRCLGERCRDFRFSRRWFRIENGDRLPGTFHPTQAGQVVLANAVAQAVNALTPPTISTTTMPNGVVGTSYSITLLTGDGRDGTWAITNGSLPPGLSLNGDTIGGTPSTAGVSQFTVRFTDPLGASVSESLTMTVEPQVTAHRDRPWLGGQFRRRTRKRLKRRRTDAPATCLGFVECD